MIPSTSLDLRSLPSARETISFPGGGLFPVQIVMANGEIASIARGGAGHLGQAGNLSLTRSRDNGITWSPPEVIVDSDQDDRNPAFGVAPDGTVILAYMLQHSYTEERQYTPDLRNADVCVMRSSDNGLSWSEPEVLDPTIYGLMSPYGRIIPLPDGSLLMSIYTAGGTPTLAPGAYLLRSSDNGQTWSAPVLVAAGFDETTLLLLPSGDLLAACRETKRDRQCLWTCRSHDQGATWSEPVRITDTFQHPADLVLLDETTVLLLYGNRQQPYRVEGRISRDGGRLWTDQLLLLVSGQLYGYAHATTRPTDMGYPSGVVTADGSRLVITYYYNPFPRVQDREWSGPWTTPFYVADGYRGVSISLDRREVLAALA